MVYRIYVEKKKELAHEAKALLSEAQNFLGIKSLTDVRVINRYDVENITKERKNWRDEMREIAKDIQSSKDTRQLSIALSALKVRINAYGIARDSIFCDSHIWKRLYFFEQVWRANHHQRYLRPAEEACCAV